MTGFGTTIASLLVAGAAAAAGLLVPDSDGRPAPHGTALVIDASVARDGRDLFDPRLRELDAELRLPRTSTEALTNVRYFAAQGYRLVVAGPRAGAAAAHAGIEADRAAGLSGALAAVGR